MLTGIVFGLLPAFRATRVALTPALKTGQRSAQGAPHSLSGRYALVAGQIALGLVLTFGAALLVRTLQNLQSVGWRIRRPDNVLVFALDARDTRFPAERVAGLCGSVLDRLRSRPGVIVGLVFDDEPDRYGDGRTHPWNSRRRRPGRAPTTSSSPTP